MTALTWLPANAHPHPSGSIDRVTPGVVRIEAAATVDITLFDDRGRLRRVNRTYTVPLGTGSGFTVAPDGVIVTATGVVRPEDDPRVYAANRIVAEYFRQSVPADFARHRVGDGDADARLQGCYPPYDDASTCLVRATPTVTVFPNTEPPMGRGLPGVVARTGGAPEAPAVVRVTHAAGRTLPTVPLAGTVPRQVTALNVIAYTGRPAAGRLPAAQTAHFEPAGSRTFKQEDRDRLTRLLGQGGNGGALVDNANSDVVAVMAADARGRLTATPVEDVRATLRAVGVGARRGPVDVVYETALAQYHTRHYGNSVPILRQVLRLRPDHAVAAEHLRTAMARRGTAADAGADDG
ncbi:MAG TPA: S1C family serine protease, partial [Thermomonospora sp.]|nr:S1C family serine protease [Thermomonospora sp.]